MSKKRRRPGQQARGRNTPAKDNAPGRGSTGQARDGRPQARDGQATDGKAPGRGDKAPGRGDMAPGRGDKAKNERKRLSGSARRAAARNAARRRKQALGVGIPVGVVVLAVIVVLLLGGGPQGGGKIAPPGSVKVTGSPLPSPTPPPEGKPPAAVDKVVPSFSAPTLDGGAVNWESGRRPTVLTVWTAWCTHCQAELPILNRVQNDYPGVDVISINTAQGRQPGPLPQDLVAKDHLTFPVAIDDANQTLMRAMGVASFPTILFINADGTVYAEKTGEVSESELQAGFAHLQEQANTMSPPAPIPSPASSPALG